MIRDMNTLHEAPSNKVRIVDPRHDDVEFTGNAYYITLNQGSSMPLWLKARAQTIDFRRGDLVRTHWKKIGQSMLDD